MCTVIFQELRLNQKLYLFMCFKFTNSLFLGMAASVQIVSVGPSFIDYMSYIGLYWILLDFKESSDD